MSYGITTAHAHLTPLDLFWPVAGEIDWNALTSWWSPGDPPPPPTFAGRYFLGSATQAEVDAGTGFCLWAHGEGRGHGEGTIHVDARMNGKGSAQVVPLKIVPLQRADPERQSTYGERGLWLGYQDAAALALHLSRCLTVGDLEIVDTKQILVFLEVADGTALSYDYWASWATTLHEAVLFSNRQGFECLQPLMPAIQCAFVPDDATGTFLPEPSVRAGLDMIASPGFRNQCHGLWARRRADDTATGVFEWSSIGEYRQPQKIAGIGVPYMRRVPVRYLRAFHGLDGSENVSETTRNTLSLLTIDLPATDGDANPVNATFRAVTWSADVRDMNAGSRGGLPTQFGVDKNRDLSSHVPCFNETQIVVPTLPSAYSWEDDSKVLHPATFHGTVLGSPAWGPCRLAFRYYSPSGTSLKNLTRAEALALSSAGYQVGVTWEGNAPTNQGDTIYIKALIRPFEFFEGRDDGRRAFEIAADTIRQPPYTPVYFAVDFPPGVKYYKTQMPSREVVIRYFQDVHRGYREYLATHPDTPYYVGAYAQADVCADLFRAGLATHFWQPWPPNWGDNWNAFPHGNAWQIVLANTDPHPDYPNLLVENAALVACTEVDINIAWGDPGTFQVFL